MPLYRVCVVHDHDCRYLQDINRETDIEALEVARAIVSGDFELWDGERFIVAVERADLKEGSLSDRAWHVLRLLWPAAPNAQPSLARSASDIAVVRAIARASLARLRYSLGSMVHN